MHKSAELRNRLWNRRASGLAALPARPLYMIQRSTWLGDEVERSGLRVEVQQRDILQFNDGPMQGKFKFLGMPTESHRC